MTDSSQIVWPTGSCFATTSTAYREFVDAARLRPLVARQIRRLRRGADVVAVGASIRTAFFDAEPRGIDHLTVTLAVDIQRMVPSELGSAREPSEDGLVLAGTASASR
jgi:phosphoenolpyruvate synthase/pyruvate phosphate dikinase